MKSLPSLPSPWESSLERVHFSKAGTPSSLHHSVGSSEGRELNAAQPKFLTFGREKMYITRVKKVKQYEQEIKVKCRVFGS